VFVSPDLVSDIRCQANRAGIEFEEMNRASRCPS
jgi:hypothetical protein